MSDVFPPARQRSALLAFMAAADIRKSSLFRDDCGDWAIHGSDGYIYACPVELFPSGAWAFPLTGAARTGYQLMVSCSSATGWTWARKRLKFGRCTQDGDDGGAIIMDRLPTAAEGKTIRDILGIPKRVHLSETQRAALAVHSFTKRVA
jgi:hypothetical protein